MKDKLLQWATKWEAVVAYVGLGVTILAFALQGRTDVDVTVQPTGGEEDADLVIEVDIDHSAETTEPVELRAALTELWIEARDTCDDRPAQRDYNEFMWRIDLGGLVSVSDTFRVAPGASRAIALPSELHTDTSGTFGITTEVWEGDRRWQELESLGTNQDTLDTEALRDRTNWVTDFSLGGPACAINVRLTAVPLGG